MCVGDEDGSEAVGDAQQVGPVLHTDVHRLSDHCGVSL